MYFMPKHDGPTHFKLEITIQGEMFEGLHLIRLNAHEYYQASNLP